MGRPSWLVFLTRLLVPLNRTPSSLTSFPTIYHLPLPTSQPKGRRHTSSRVYWRPFGGGGRNGVSSLLQLGASVVLLWYLPTSVVFLWYLPTSVVLLWYLLPTPARSVQPLHSEQYPGGGGIASTMPYHDSEYPGQTLGQAVLLFCCKGVVEGVMVLLFLWLLIQVLFSKQLEVHLQVLLVVGLVVFCSVLILGCVLCWRGVKARPLGNKEPLPPPSAPLAAPAVPQPQSPPPVEVPVFPVGQRGYEELAGDVLDRPSPSGSPTPSDDSFATPPFSWRPASNLKEHPRSYFPLRRLSTPAMSRAPRQAAPPPRSLPRLGVLARVLERRCSLTADGFSQDERSRLTGSGTRSPSLSEEPLPPDPLQYGSVPLQYGSVPLQYGSVRRPPPPALSFTMAFSPERSSLTVTVLGLSGTSHSLADVSVMGSLAPLYPCPLLASPSASPAPAPAPAPPSLGLVLRVGSVEELRRCVLRLAVYSRDLPSLRGSPLGGLEVQCGGKDWEPDQPLYCTQELSAEKWKLKKSLTSQDAQRNTGGPKVLGCPPVEGPGLFILLQYQNLTHRIKAMVLRADNLANLPHTLGVPDHLVVINLRHEGVVIATGETAVVGGANTVWNTPVLFDLPPCDVTQLPLMLEFIVMQDQRRILGRVLIGAEAPAAGRAHWREVCGQGQVERACWHTVQPELF